MEALGWEWEALVKYAGSLNTPYSKEALVGREVHMAHCLEWDDASMVVEALLAAGWEVWQISGFQEFQDV